jgi:23S rRNA (cytosine1962-C5)-methyltransferase
MKLDPRRIEAALQRRAAIDPRATDAVRLINAEGDGFPDLTLDRFADVGVMSLYRTLDEAEERAWVETIASAVPLRALYLKRRPREARVAANTQKGEVAPELPVRGEAVSELVARENGLSFRIRPGQGLSVGLYLDMRELRGWLAARAKGQRVLNLFAYTCAFGVAAIAGGATRAVNVDLSRRVLDWGEENARLNAQPVDRRDFISGDVFDWLKRFGKKGESFDAVVLDPPAFSTTRGQVFRVERDYPRLVSASAALVLPGGLLLACCNQASLTSKRFETLVRQGLTAAGRDATHLEKLGPSPIDFPPPPGEEPALKVLAVRLR